MTDFDDKLLIKQSVTKGDIGSVDNGVIRLMIPMMGMYQDQAALAPKPPPYYSRERDFVLSTTIFHEAMWASAIGIAITQMASLAWEVSSAVTLRARNAHEILLMADGSRVGWVGFISKHLRDYLLTDNGAFVEIVRMTKHPKSPVVGIRHLDSKRCTRTGDMEIPVLYRDKLGKEHEMRAHQVFAISDMQDPGDTYFGTGFCAASRAYPAIYKLMTLETYVSEKLSGRRPLAVYIVNGLLTGQIEGAITAAKETQVGKGFGSFMGAVMIGIPAQEQPGLVTIPLAELPDGFERKQEFDLGVLTYADAIGLDPQDLQPLSGQPMGTGAQSQVLDDKSRGKGLSAWRQQITQMFNEFVMPRNVKFAFIERDYRDQEKRAAVSKARADVSKARIEAGITLPEQEMQMLVDQDELPRSFLVKGSQDRGDRLSDDEPTSLEQPVPAAEPPEQFTAPGEEQPQEETSINNTGETTGEEETPNPSEGYSENESAVIDEIQNEETPQEEPNEEEFKKMEKVVIGKITQKDISGMGNNGNFSKLIAEEWNRAMQIYQKRA